MGYKTNEIVEAMPGLLSAAAAGQTDLGTTADITSNILSGFGLAASETSKVADVLTKTFTSSNVDLAMLGETMKYVAPTAKAMGISLEEVAAASGILGNAGIQGSQAGTSLSMSLTRLASPAKEAKELMAELGFNAFDAEGKMLPLHKVVENLQTSTAGLTQEQKLHAISTIFGAESMKSMLTLLEAGPGTLKDFSTELENAGGTAESIASKQLDNLNGQFTILKSALEGAAISLGMALMPAIKTVVSVVQGAVSWFNGLSETTKSLISIGLGLTAVFLLIAGPILMLIGFLPAIISGFTAIAGAMAITTSTLLIGIGVVVLVIAALVALGVGLYMAYQKVDWFRDAVDTAWSKVKDAFNVALTFITKIVKDVMSAVSDFIGTQLKKITKFWDENGMQIMAAVKNIWKFVMSYVENAMTTIKAVFQIIWPIIQGIVKIAWGVIKNVIGTTVDVILGIIKLFAKIFTGDWKGAFDTVLKIATDIWNGITGIFRGIDLFSIGKDIIRGLLNGLSSMMGGVTRMVGKIASLIPDGVKSFLGIKSPSRVMMQIGGHTAEGLKLGIGKGINGIQRMAGEMASAATPDMNRTSLSYGLSGSGASSSATATPTSSQSINLTLNYSGTGSKDDANGMLDFIEQGLSERLGLKLRMNGVR